MLRMFIKCCKYLKRNPEGTFADPALEGGGIKADKDSLVCPVCKAKGRVEDHGSYERYYVFVENGGYACRLIGVARVMCTSCKTTHALLPLTAVPHSVFSVMFTAAVVKDHLERAYPSMEALADHWQISLSTAKRMVRRFAAAAGLFFGVTEGKARMGGTAGLLASGPSVAMDAFLESFFLLRGRSFLQA